MMKKGITNSLACMALILISIAFVNGLTDSCWEDFFFYGGILLMGILYSTWQIVLRYMDIKNYRLELLVNFIGTLGIALILGKIFQWYSDIHNVIYVCMEVIMAFVIGYILGLVKTKREVERINIALQKRR